MLNKCKVKQLHFLWKYPTYNTKTLIIKKLLLKKNNPVVINSCYSFHSLKITVHVSNILCKNLTNVQPKTYLIFYQRFAYFLLKNKRYSSSIGGNKLLNKTLLSII